MEDYWNEVHIIGLDGKEDSFTSHEKTHDECDETDADTSFFENLGLSIGGSSQEDLLYEGTDQFMNTLTARQEAVLKRRVETLNASRKQRRHKHKQNKPDIRSFFSANDSSSTGTRSRSATPDSLDSVSPPHTPPDPKTWGNPFLSRSRGSLDSGNHSLVTVPCYQPSSSPTQVTVTGCFLQQQDHPNPNTLVTVNNNNQRRHVPAPSYPPQQPSSACYSPTAFHHHYNHHHDERPSSTSTLQRSLGGTSIVTILSSPSGGESSSSSMSPLPPLNGSEHHHQTHHQYKCSPSPKVSSSECGGKYSLTYITNDGGGDEPDGSCRVQQAHGLDDRSLDLNKTNVTVLFETSSSSSVSSSPCFEDESKDRSSSSSPEQQPTSSPSTNTPSHETRWKKRSNSRYIHYPEGRPTTLIRAPSLDALSSSPDNTTARPRIRRQRSYARDIAKDVKLYYTKGVYELKPQHYQSHDRSQDVQVLRYQNIGSMHIPRAQHLRPKINVDGAPPCEDGGLGAAVSHRRTSKESPPSPVEGHQRGTRPRSASTTDYGFIVLPVDANVGEETEPLPELELQAGRSGCTRMDWLHEDDLVKLKSLALLELEIIFGDHNISHRWRSGKSRRGKEADSRVFGVSLATLLERDASYLPEPHQSVPQVFIKLVSQLEVHGVQEVGILRIPGNNSKTEALRTALDTHFYASPSHSDEALRHASPNDVVACIKLFLRLLPEPLLTRAYLSAFHKAHRIEPLEERVVALTMLLLLLPSSHRETLKALLQLCSKVIQHQHLNKMGLYNVATIIAPNLFPPPSAAKNNKIRTDAKEQVLEYARASCELCQMLIKYQDVLWTVPPRLIGQIRRQLQSQKSSSGTKPISRLLSRKHRDPAPHHCSDAPHGCELTVHAPQFNRPSVTVTLTHSLTVKEALGRLVEEHNSTRCNGGERVEGRREQNRHAPSSPNHEAPDQQHWTCLLRGTKHALLTHALHERGGNINERRLDPRALLLAIYQDNPNADYLVKCHHPGGIIHSPHTA